MLLTQYRFITLWTDPFFKLVWHVTPSAGCHVERSEIVPLFKLVWFGTPTWLPRGAEWDCPRRPGWHLLPPLSGSAPGSAGSPCRPAKTWLHPDYDILLVNSWFYLSKYLFCTLHNATVKDIPLLNDSFQKCCVSRSARIRIRLVLHFRPKVYKSYNSIGFQHLI